MQNYCLSQSLVSIVLTAQYGRAFHSFIARCKNENLAASVCANGGSIFFNWGQGDETYIWWVKLMVQSRISVYGLVYEERQDGIAYVCFPMLEV